MTGKNSLRLIILFVVAFSLGILAGPSSSNFHLPTIPLASAIPQPCETHGSGGACSEFWYPAGPAMNTLTDIIFTDVTAEITDIHSFAPVIDFPDSPCSPAECAFDTSSSQFYITAPIPAQFGYLRCAPLGPCTPANSWVRAINDAGLGLPNYFTWLNARNPAPPQLDTIRQGFSQTTRSVNPYIASTAHDGYLVGSVYDTLFVSNPLAPAQSIQLMTLGEQQLTNSALTYTPPAGTTATFRFTLRGDIFFQDGRQLTSYDLAFSYLSLVGSGSFAGSVVTGMTGITILGLHLIDISLSSVGPSTLSNLTSLPIVPGRYWTSAGSSAWDAATSSCAMTSNCPFSITAPPQYSLSGSTVNCTQSCSPFTAALMTVSPADVSATFDPIANHTFVGSGPWECGIVTSAGSGVCSSSGTENPPVGGSYTLTRFGNGISPASSVTSIYFRSSGNLALCIWATGCTVDFTRVPPFLIISQVFACFGQPVNLNGPCAHWQRGMGNPNGTPVSLSQVSIALRFAFVSWIAPFLWNTNPPVGIGTFPPVLYEGSVTLNPCSIDPVNGYDC